jgi:hypothetical protein
MLSLRDKMRIDRTGSVLSSSTEAATRGLRISSGWLPYSFSSEIAIELEAIQIGVNAELAPVR